MTREQEDAVLLAMVETALTLGCLVSVRYDYDWFKYLDDLKVIKLALSQYNCSRFIFRSSRERLVGAVKFYRGEEKVDFLHNLRDDPEGPHGQIIFAAIWASGRTALDAVS